MVGKLTILATIKLIRKNEINCGWIDVILKLRSYLDESS